MKSYKNFRCYYAILAVLITGFYLSSCKKTEPLTSNGTESSHSMEEKFFGNHRSNDPTEVAFVEFLKRVNEKENFVEKTVMQIGYPRWDKTFIKPKNLPNLQQNLTGDSTEHYYIPFVRDSQNFVNAAMIITATPTDTSFSYRVDCDYRQLANSTTSVHDDAEYLAIFFMFMDKRVFGYHKFAIKDSNLFKENGNKATKIELTAAAANPTNGNLWDYVEFCQDVYLSSTNCNLSIPNCPIHTTYSTFTYCWGEWIETGSGGGGGTTTTGGGGSGGSPTPPSSCQGGGGTTPIPTIPDEPSLPATLIRVDYSTIIDPCLISVIHNIGLEGHGSYILKTYFDQNLNLNGPQKKYHIKYLTNTTLTGDYNTPLKSDQRVS